jgi:hypothetical protein
VSTALFILVLSAPLGSSSGSASAPVVGAQSAGVVQASSPIVNASVRIDRGPDSPPLLIPRDETLSYVVGIDLGILGDLRVGTVVLSSGALELSEPEPPSRPAGWIRDEANGSYLGYRLKQVLDVRLRSQEWPAVLYTDVQTGSENRRHELRIGVRDGRPTFQFEEDHHCPGCSSPEHMVSSIWPWSKPHHCDGCKRMEHRRWDVSITRSTPLGTVDLLSAVYLARSMVEEGRDKDSFPVLDEDKLWILNLRAGGRREIETPAGRFACQLVELATNVPPGEVRAKDDFSGLFGIKGSIQIWMDSAAGVPVQITGDLPVPVIGRLNVNAKLASFRGTPRDFASSR